MLQLPSCFLYFEGETGLYLYIVLIYKTNTEKIPMKLLPIMSYPQTITYIVKTNTV